MSEQGGFVDDALGVMDVVANGVGAAGLPGTFSQAGGGRIPGVPSAVGGVASGYGMVRAGQDMVENGVGLQNSADMVANGAGVVSAIAGATPLGLLTGAFSGGYALGQFLDQTFGISEAIVPEHNTGMPDEVAARRAVDPEFDEEIRAAEQREQTYTSGRTRVRRYLAAQRFGGDQMAANEYLQQFNPEGEDIDWNLVGMYNGLPPGIPVSDDGQAVWGD